MPGKQSKRKTVTPAVHPKSPEPGHDWRTILTARIDTLLDRIHTLEKENEELIMSAAAATAAPAVKKNKPPVKIGTVVFFQPPESLGQPVSPALVIGGHDEDGSVDLRVQLGYCQGTMDVKGAHLADPKVKGTQWGTYSKDVPKDDDEPPVIAQPHGNPK
jgi:hypothetical protein